MLALDIRGACAHYVFINAALPLENIMARKHVVHFRSGNGFVSCGADRMRRGWGVVRDVSSVASVEAFAGLSEASRCTRCVQRVAKMLAVQKKNDERTISGRQDQEAR